MAFSYPGENTHLENHGVSEESFWPSFTDIMMVIVMVFLLVTVAVILNNWSLIADLKNSIKAQEVASSLAENRQVTNNSLASKLSSLEKQILLLSTKYKNEQENLTTSQKSLSSTQKKLSDNKKQLQEKSTSFSLLEQKLAKKLNELTASKKIFDKSITAKNTDIDKLKSTAVSRESILASLQIDSSKTKEALSLLQSNYDQTQDSLKAKILATQKIQSVLTVLRKDKSEQNEKLVSVQGLLKEAKAEKQRIIVVMNDKLTEQDKKLQLTQKTVEDTEAEKQRIIVVMNNKLATKDENIQSIQNKADEAEAEKQRIIVVMDNKFAKQDEKLQITRNAAEETEAEKQRIIIIMNKKIADAEGAQSMQAERLESLENILSKTKEEKQEFTIVMNKKLDEASSKIAPLELSVTHFATLLNKKTNELVAIKSNGDSQLRSLQGEYDSLDVKYQKLLQPARSSKGKFIVTVYYRKKAGGQEVIRMKESPEAPYKTVNDEELQSALATLKKKHKDDLYLKIIIPGNSGLSYNDAWTFTNNLHKRYDYYHSTR